MSANPNIVEDDVTDVARTSVIVSLDSSTNIETATEKLNNIPDQEHSQTVIIRLIETSPQKFFEECLSTEMVNRWERAVRRLERLDAITVAAASGRCGGVALDLLLACDYRLATPDFALVLPIHRGRFWPGMCLYRLVQQAGITATRRILSVNDNCSPQSCIEIGIIDEIDTQMTQRINQLACYHDNDGPDRGVRRRLMLEALSTPYEEAIGSHLATCDRELRLIEG